MSTWEEEESHSFLLLDFRFFKLFVDFRSFVVYRFSLGLGIEPSLVLRCLGRDSGESGNFTYPIHYRTRGSPQTRPSWVYTIATQSSILTARYGEINISAPSGRSASRTSQLPVCTCVAAACANTKHPISHSASPLSIDKAVTGQLRRMSLSA
jgi:hypothetical protein